MPDVCRVPYDGAVRTPLRRVEEACCWIADGYPRKWMRLVGLCERAMAQGWPRIRRGDLFVLATQQGMTISEAMEFRFDNNLWSILSRYLLMFRPALAGAIFPKAAEVDTVDLAAVWHGSVEAATVFLADSWQDAQAAYDAGDASAA